MKLIKIWGRPCSVQGINSPSGEQAFFLNSDLIAAVTPRKEVILSGGADILNLSGNYYNHIRLHEDVKMEDLI
ncbi:hypothetical protein [Fibrella forsythiae]|uniref:Uncharacterized protein n=1 Tax=Fibrella forsythiae TaxID=2817061 RepID=A0ABS3JTB8_9BACT|nr:hypothetical protein [Fibrella forsythiae]MBO0953265.1 hypothetical protein [Fibrella forsythiae]